jgi:preprotein translocase subunit SecA
MSTAKDRIAGSRGTNPPGAAAWAASGSQPPSAAPALMQAARLLGAMPLLPLADSLLQREDRRASLRAMRQARVAADRIFAVEHCRLPLHHLAEVARRELRAGRNPAAAFLDSLALAAIAAQRVLGLRPHLAQMATAVSVLQGRAAELGCGEGKSLALALAAAVRGLEGRPVHLVFRDDQQVEAQAALLRPFFGALGLDMGAVSRAAIASRRREAYRADVCIATARELALDQLHDAEGHAGHPPGRTCAIVDDIDSQLIDEALQPFDPAGDSRVPPLTTRQAFFSRYGALGGASSTLGEARRELAALYGLGVTTIASIYPCFRQELGSSVSANAEQWLLQVVGRVRALVAKRRAVMLIAADETSSRMLARALHAGGVPAVRIGPDDRDGDGRGLGRGAEVAICTVDFARDVRIELDAYARAAGGLAVVSTCVAPTRRAERRLGYLAGHRGQPGSVETIAALPLPGVLSHLPEPLMRSFVFARRRLQEWRSERERGHEARRSSRQQVPHALPSPGRAPHLQHEGS